MTRLLAAALVAAALVSEPGYVQERDDSRTIKVRCTMRDESIFPGWVYFRFQAEGGAELTPFYWLYPKDGAPAGWRPGAILQLTLDAPGTLTAAAR